MTVTVISNYRDTYAPETIEVIDRLLPEHYDLTAMLQFIDEHSEKDFREQYVRYVDLGEEYGYDAVDAFLEEFADPEQLESFSDAYCGRFSYPAKFAEYVADNDVFTLPNYILVDWEGTADVLLATDYTRVGNFYFCNYGW